MGSCCIISIIRGRHEGAPEGAKRPTAGDEPREFTSRGEGGCVPPFIEKLRSCLAKWVRRARRARWAICGTRLLAALLLIWPGVVLADNSLKGKVRSFFGLFADAASEADIKQLPDGIELVAFPGCKGLRIESGKFGIEPITWNESRGLLDELVRRDGSGTRIIAGINGSFFSTRGILGQVVLPERKLPIGVRQISASFSRCFVATIKGKSGRRWVFGETVASAKNLLSADFPANVFLNRPMDPGDQLESVLGGGGWIVREGKDVHMESYKRQRFRFRKVDRDSRHTVIAMDALNRLYLLIFEAGANLELVSSMLRVQPELKGLTDAFFLDGGSSSVLVLRGKYLVAPLYLIDKARFSGLTVVSENPKNSKSPKSRKNPWNRQNQ